MYIEGDLYDYTHRIHRAYTNKDGHWCTPSCSSPSIQQCHGALLYYCELLLENYYQSLVMHTI